MSVLGSVTTDRCPCTKLRFHSLSSPHRKTIFPRITYPKKTSAVKWAQFNVSLDCDNDDLEVLSEAHYMAICRASHVRGATELMSSISPQKTSYTSYTRQEFAHYKRLQHGLHSLARARLQTGDNKTFKSCRSGFVGLKPTRLSQLDHQQRHLCVSNNDDNSNNRRTSQKWNE